MPWAKAGRGWLRHVTPLIPNAITLAAVFCGLNALRFSGEQRFDLAIAAIFAAAALDTADGWTARLLSAESEIGAELDSLADFLNFGVAPALLIYEHDVQSPAALLWLAVIAYVMAAGLRLARFNVTRRASPKPRDGFQGLPSTGAAVLLLTADAVLHWWAGGWIGTNPVIAVTMILSALMVSSIPVPSLGSIRRRLSGRDDKS